MKRVKIILVGLFVFFSFIFFANNVSAALVVDGASCAAGSSNVCSSSGQRCRCIYDDMDGYTWYCAACSSGYYCSGGACLRSPTPTPKPSCSGSGGSCIAMGECRAQNGGMTINGTDCPGTEVCCRDPINGVCGSANNSASPLPLPYSSWNPGSSQLCSSGGISWSGLDQEGTDGDYNWRCYGLYGGSDRTCAGPTNSCQYSLGGTCVGLGAACPVGYSKDLDYLNRVTGDSCGVYNYSCCLPTCKTATGGSGVCAYTIDGCNAYGGTVSNNPYECSGLDVCCYSGGTTNKCTTTDQCEYQYDNCHYCGDSPIIPGSPITIKDCLRETASTDSIDGKNEIYNGTSGVCQTYPTGVCQLSDITTRCTSGTATVPVLTGSTYNWSCNGSAGGTCGGTNGSNASCTTTKLSVASGDCSTSTGACNAGTAVGTGVTQPITGGINNVWSCTGTCGGSTDNCSSTFCTNSPVVNGACKSNITGTSASDLCFAGTPVYDSKDANHDYINDSNESEYVWGCEGSTNTCNEGDGTDQLGCVSIIDQNPWFRVNNGSIVTKSKVTNYVPVTCSGNNCATVVNGGVYAGTVSKSGFDKTTVSYEGNLNNKIYYYDQLKRQYFTNKGVGTTFGSANGGSNWNNVKNSTGVLFVDGDLTIDQNLATSNFVMIVAGGKITIDPSVNRVDGILVGKSVVATGDSTQTLIINGVVHGANEVEFSRNLTPRSVNNNSPSVEVNYKPELLFKVPQELVRALNQWKVY